MVIIIIIITTTTITFIQSVYSYVPEKKPYL